MSERTGGGEVRRWAKVPEIIIVALSQDGQILALDLRKSMESEQQVGLQVLDELATSLVDEDDWQSLRNLIEGNRTAGFGTMWERRK